ncbi:hypothetical protein N782_10580 [Pontibacillus yanchengensis Y32]|uniref:Uncharacterized protein n=1 Tax=Pontibacillus yanchengensis Y32 TaxID=1385514 RepID=A0A0A2TFD4_9BACI|nr:hypothetical protein N782_10580 [Pontibacillus yanchengensis Y32]
MCDEMCAGSLCERVFEIWSNFPDIGATLAKFKATFPNQERPPQFYFLAMFPFIPIIATVVVEQGGSRRRMR